MVNKKFILRNLSSICNNLGVYEFEIITDKDVEFINERYSDLRGIIENLINAVKYLWNKLEDTQIENEELKLQIQHLQEEIEYRDKQLSQVKQVKKVNNKPAYKSEANNLVIIEMLRRGKSKVQIAKELGVDRSLIYRRLKEMEKAGIKVENYIKKQD